MAFIADLDRTVFENLCKGVHDFNEEELTRLHEAAGKVKEVLKSANDREQRSMMARCQLKQMG